MNFKAAIIFNWENGGRFCDGTESCKKLLLFGDTFRGALMHGGNILYNKQNENEKIRERKKAMFTISSHIVYEDGQLLVCHKPQGLAVQSAGVGTMDLESAAKNYLAQNTHGKIPYLAVVHRLDQPVEGVVILAKTPKAAAGLSRQITEGKVQKYYLAVSCRVPEEKNAVLEDVLLKDGRANLSRIVPAGTPNGKKARLSYRVLEEKESRGLFEIRLYTGRHHQIRVQMAGHGMPLVGDRKYNVMEGSKKNEKLALCAWRIIFRHPGTGKEMEVKIRPENPLFQMFDWKTEE